MSLYGLGLGDALYGGMDSALTLGGRIHNWQVNRQFDPYAQKAQYDAYALKNVQSHNQLLKEHTMLQRNWADYNTPEYTEHQRAQVNPIGQTQQAQNMQSNMGQAQLASVLGISPYGNYTGNNGMQPAFMRSLYYQLLQQNGGNPFQAIQQLGY